MKWILLPVFLALCGCANVGQKQAGRDSPPEAVTRDNAASLLYDLLNDEKNVSKILIIKHDREELHGLIKTISAMCGESSKRLARLADERPEMNLHAKNLPPGEAAAREAESKTKEKELLHASGGDFEFKLLLTQIEALNYGRHLASVAAQNSSVAEESRAFAEISEALRQLYEQTLSLLRRDSDRGS